MYHPLSHLRDPHSSYLPITSHLQPNMSYPIDSKQAPPGYDRKCTTIPFILTVDTSLQQQPYHAPEQHQQHHALPQQQHTGAWDPQSQPAGQQPMGTYSPNHNTLQPQASRTMAMAQPVGTPGTIIVGQYPTATFCPATGGAHVPTSSAGAMGIIIGIVFCPCGLIA